MTITFIDLANKYLDCAKHFREHCSDSQFEESRSLGHYTALIGKAKFFHSLAFKANQYNSDEELFEGL